MATMPGLRARTECKGAGRVAYCIKTHHTLAGELSGSSIVVAVKDFPCARNRSAIRSAKQQLFAKLSVEAVSGAGKVHASDHAGRTRESRQSGYHRHPRVAIVAVAHNDGIVHGLFSLRWRCFWCVL